MNKINLTAGWNDLWGAVASALGQGITRLMLVVGVGLVVLSVFSWIWKRRRSGGGGMQDMNGVWWTMAVGAILAAPSFLIPILLRIVDGIINAVIGILQLGG